MNREGGGPQQDPKQQQQQQQPQQYFQQHQQQQQRSSFMHVPVPQPGPQTPPTPPMHQPPPRSSPQGGHFLPPAPPQPHGGNTGAVQAPAIPPFSPASLTPTWLSAISASPAWLGTVGPSPAWGGGGASPALGGLSAGASTPFASSSSASPQPFTAPGSLGTGNPYTTTATSMMEVHGTMGVTEGWEMDDDNYSTSSPATQGSTGAGNTTAPSTTDDFMAPAPRPRSNSLSSSQVPNPQATRRFYSATPAVTASTAVAPGSVPMPMPTPTTTTTTMPMPVPLSPSLSPYPYSPIANVLATSPSAQSQMSVNGMDDTSMDTLNDPAIVGGIVQERRDTRLSIDSDADLVSLRDTVDSTDAGPVHWDPEKEGYLHSPVHSSPVRDGRLSDPMARYDTASHDSEVNSAEGISHISRSPPEFAPYSPFSPASGHPGASSMGAHGSSSSAQRPPGASTVGVVAVGMDMAYLRFKSILDHASSRAHAAPNFARSRSRSLSMDPEQHLRAMDGASMSPAMSSDDLIKITPTESPRTIQLRGWALSFSHPSPITGVGLATLEDCRPEDDLSDDECSSGGGGALNMGRSSSLMDTGEPAVTFAEGVVWPVAVEALSLLDRWHGCPHMSRRVEVRPGTFAYVRSQSSFLAMRERQNSYKRQSSRALDDASDSSENVDLVALRPPVSYKKALVSLAHEMGLSRDYCRWLDSVETCEDAIQAAEDYLDDGSVQFYAVSPTHMPRSSSTVSLMGVDAGMGASNVGVRGGGAEGAPSIAYDPARGPRVDLTTMDSFSQWVDAHLQEGANPAAILSRSRGLEAMGATREDTEQGSVNGDGDGDGDGDDGGGDGDGEINGAGIPSSLIKRKRAASSSLAQVLEGRNGDGSDAGAAGRRSMDDGVEQLLNQLELQVDAVVDEDGPKSGRPSLRPPVNAGSDLGPSTPPAHLSASGALAVRAQKLSLAQRIASAPKPWHAYLNTRVKNQQQHFGGLGVEGRFSAPRVPALPSSLVSMVYGSLSSVQHVFLCGVLACDSMDEVPGYSKNMYSAFLESLVCEAPRPATLVNTLLVDKGRMPVTVLRYRVGVDVSDPKNARYRSKVAQRISSFTSDAGMEPDDVAMYHQAFSRGVQGFVVRCATHEQLGNLVHTAKTISGHDTASIRFARVDASASATDHGVGNGAGSSSPGAPSGAGVGAGPETAGAGPSASVLPVWVCNSPLDTFYDVVEDGDWTAHRMRQVSEQEDPTTDYKRNWVCVNCVEQQPLHRRICMSCGFRRGVTVEDVVSMNEPLLRSPAAVSGLQTGGTTGHGGTPHTAMSVDGFEEMLYHAEDAGIPPSGEFFGHEAHPADIADAEILTKFIDAGERAATDESCDRCDIGGWKRLLVEEPSSHPERPDRLRAIMSHLRRQGLISRCRRVGCRSATVGELQSVHPLIHVRKVEATHDLRPVDGGETEMWRDAYCCPGSARAAAIAAGTTIEVTNLVASGSAKNGVAMVRPPGHHAEPNTCMGFCLYNNVAVAAQVAKTTYNLERILIVDWDVHHGNGTQNMFETDPSILYMSLHRYPFYPGTGAAQEAGRGPGEGFNVNIGWDTGGMGDAEYLTAFDRVIMPIARAYNPQLVFISAGFDAAEGDPLGGCSVTPVGYSQMTHRLSALAEGRMVLVLEGGYNLRSISRSVEACVRVMLGEPPLPVVARSDGTTMPDKEAMVNIMETAAVHTKYWPVLREVWGSALDNMIRELEAQVSDSEDP